VLYTCTGTLYNANDCIVAAYCVTTGHVLNKLHIRGLESCQSHKGMMSRWFDRIHRMNRNNFRNEKGDPNRAQLFHFTLK